jgi:hypothetical protein
LHYRCGSWRIASSSRYDSDWRDLLPLYLGRFSYTPGRPRALADKLGATVVESGAEPVDLIVVGSAPGAPEGPDRGRW